MDRKLQNVTTNRKSLGCCSEKSILDSYQCHIVSIKGSPKIFRCISYRVNYVKLPTL